MAKSLSELDLKDEKLPEQSFDDLPEFTGFQDPPQPGPYRFKLPGDLSHAWDKVESSRGERIALILDRDAPLLITQSAGGRYNGETFTTRLSNVERKRGKDGPEVSDLDYLLKATLGPEGKTTKRPTSNKAYLEMVKQQAGKEFGADITYSFSCNVNRNIRVSDEAGKLVEVEGQKGCGKKIYQRDVQKEEGEYPTLIQCPQCGAVLRAFANLENFRS